MAASPALAAAAKAQAPKPATGAYSGALNNISSQETANAAVAARRQADAKAYAAYVMGQQGSIAAAAHTADQAALGQTMGVAGATLGAQLKLQQGLQAQRAAQGLPGDVPAQQQAGLVSDQQTHQALLGALAGSQAARGNTNAGKAGFLAAATNANLLANQRGIAGDAFNQQQQLEGQKTNILMTKTQSAMADRRAQQAALASAANAQLAHEDRLAALAQSGANAQLGATSRENVAAANASARATQGHLSRIASLKRAKITSTATGAGANVPPAQKAARQIRVQKLGDQVSSVAQLAHTLAGNGVSKQDVVTALTTPGSKQYVKDLNPAALHAALSVAFGKGGLNGKIHGPAAKYLQDTIDAMTNGTALPTYSG